ncbi:hypothetical protein CMU99_06720 [Elizabethkingia anophelis]|nr:hypothetical protein [Elizabethkingia anophelis]
MWHKERKKTVSGQQELQVCCIVSEMCELNSSSEEIVRYFKNELMKIRRRNSFEASHAYKAEIVDVHTIEIWKMKVNCDKNYLMYILRKGEDTPDPFAHLFKI